MGGLKCIAFIFCCSVATDLRVLSFSSTDDLQDPVCYSTKLVCLTTPLATHTVCVERKLLLEKDFIEVERSIF